MNYFLEYWQNHKKMTIVIIVFTLIIYIISLVFVANKVNEMAENHYRPVRMSAASEKIQVGGIFSDPDDVSKIKSASFFILKIIRRLNRKLHLSYIIIIFGKMKIIFLILIISILIEILMLRK